MIKQYGGEQGNNAYILSKVQIPVGTIPDNSSHEKFCEKLVEFAKDKPHSIFVCFKDSYVFDANPDDPQKLLKKLTTNLSSMGVDMTYSFSRWISEFVKNPMKQENYQ